MCVQITAHSTKLSSPRTVFLLTASPELTKRRLREFARLKKHFGKARRGQAVCRMCMCKISGVYQGKRSDMRPSEGGLPSVSPSPQPVSPCLRRSPLWLCLDRLQVSTRKVVRLM